MKELFKENKEYYACSFGYLEKREEDGQFQFAKISKEEEEALDLIGEHTEWFMNTIRKIYYDAMKHGYRHGFEDGCNSANEEVE